MSNDITSRLSELAASAQARPVAMHPALLRAITERFVLHPQHTPQEVRLYEELAAKLIPGADESSLIVVAQKLSAAADAPASVLKLVRERGGAAALELFRVDTRIDWRELRQIAASGPGEHAAAIAGRSDLDRELTKILSQRPERDIALALAGNALAPLALDDLRLLIFRGRGDGILARALLNRGDLTLDHLPLYLAANETERARLIRLTRYSGLALVGRSDAAPVDGPLCNRLEASALKLDRAGFALLVAEMLNCGADCGRRLVEDESGDALTLAFIALGVPREICARIFLIAFPRVGLSCKAFDRNLALFASMPRRDATLIIGAITGAQKSESLRAVARREPPVSQMGTQAERPALKDEKPGRFSAAFPTVYFTLATTPTIGPIGKVKSSRSSSGA